MELDMTSLYNELSSIISRRSLSDIILIYCLGIKEAITNLKHELIISKKLIELLRVIKPHVIYPIDITELEDLYNNNTPVEVIYEDLEASGSSSSSGSEIDNRIQKMLIEDSYHLSQTINDGYLEDNNYYGVEETLLHEYRKLFNTLDFNKDNYISALDIIHSINNKFFLDASLYEIFTILINNKNKLDFRAFIFNFIY